MVTLKLPSVTQCSRMRRSLGHASVTAHHLQSLIYSTICRTLSVIDHMLHYSSPTLSISYLEQTTSFMAQMVGQWAAATCAAPPSVIAG